MDKKLLAVDAHSLMYRAFYALPALTNEKGQYTNAVFGFFSMLMRALSDVLPTHLGICFDFHAKTLRQEKYVEYKAQRKPMPPELIPQFDMLKAMLADMGVNIFEREGIEGDDFLGALAQASADSGYKCVVLTGDRDAFQLINGNVNVLLTKKGVTESLLYDESLLLETYGVTPSQVPDLKGLMGDASDNIPGVPGVGEKTALKLIAEFGSIDGLYKRIGEVKGKLGEKLSANKELAHLSLELATIDCGVELCHPIESLALPADFAGRLSDTFAKYGFATLSKRVASQTAPESAAPEAIEISDMESLEAFIEEIRRSGEVSVVFTGDIEFGLNGKAYRLNCPMNLLSGAFTPDAAYGALAPVFEDESIYKLVFNKKALAHRLSEFGAELKNAPCDVLVAEYCLTPTDKSFAFEAVCEKYGFAPSAAFLPELFSHMKGKIDNEGLKRIFYDIETPLTDVLYRMEKRGFCVDIDTLDRLNEEYIKKIDENEKAVYELAGEVFNINSPKQLGEILFVKLGLPAGKKNKTGFSTDANVLEQISFNPIVKHVLVFRQYSKLKSTYIDGIRRLMTPMGRVHTTFKQEATVTGRISSTEPNLQNIPQRTAEGREIRRMFRASDENHVLVCADYSQIELRILAHLSGDGNMINAFRSGFDIHAATAAEVFGKPIEDVTPAERSQAKAVNFGIVYGISDFGLSRNLNIPRSRAHSLIERYFEEFPGVRAYMSKTIEEAKKNGYVTTMWGRRRELAELKSLHYQTRQFGERAALNTPVQGSAADMIKLAMIEVSRSLIEGGYSSSLILQVHDELIIDAVREERTAVANLVRECMEGVAALDVPLVANVSFGQTWFDAK